MAEYAVVIPVRIESFDWRGHGDEWMHRVGECLGELEGHVLAGRRYDATTKPFIEFTEVGPGGDVLDTRLAVVPLQTGALVAVAGKTEEPDEAAVDAWVRAVQCAAARLGSQGREFRWTAVLGPPSARIGGAEPALASEATVGPFRLAPVGHPLHEILQPHIPSLGSASPGVSWPILVKACHRGYNWDAASKGAAFELHRLIALLSLVLGECLVVREGPVPVEFGNRQVPERLWWQSWGDDGESSARAEPGKMVTVPEWAADAWRRLEKRPRLADAVVAHHEGLRAQVHHPSLALVAFIASVEAVANLLFKEERCPQCRGHLDVAARFRATLRMVMSDEEAIRLGAVYSPRSLTVHQGRLHGDETTPGVYGFSWGEDPVREFEYDVWAMRGVSRDLLRRAVRGELPSSRVTFDRALHLPKADPAAEHNC